MFSNTMEHALFLDMLWSGPPLLSGNQVAHWRTDREEEPSDLIAITPPLVSLIVASHPRVRDHDAAPQRVPFYSRERKGAA